jgi:hypothetical protein
LKEAERKPPGRDQPLGKRGRAAEGYGSLKEYARFFRFF